ncbi:MAG TPA: signal peptidase II [Candidatus Sulfotelmatobacter sp.]|nr:signal peptidase II [Candidatus Sulfotelmatobacter sp.]
MILLVTAIAVFAVDHLSKWLVASRLPLGARFPESGPVIVHNVHNSGAAFGLFPQLQGLYLIVAAVVAAYILFAGYRYPHPFQQAVLGAILGGAVANAFDRLTQGYVVDFIDVATIPVIHLKWAVFNIADSAIVVGVILVVLFFRAPPRGASRAPREEQRGEQASPAQASAQPSAQGDEAAG